MPTGFLFLLIFMIGLAASSTKVVSETQRLVVYRLGRFFGQFVRIQSFTDKDAVVIPDTTPAREFVCEKCGHINRV